MEGNIFPSEKNSDYDFVIDFSAKYMENEEDRFSFYYKILLLNSLYQLVSVSYLSYYLKKRGNDYQYVRYDLII